MKIRKSHIYELLLIVVLSSLFIVCLLYDSIVSNSGNIYSLFIIFCVIYLLNFLTIKYTPYYYEINEEFIEAKYFNLLFFKTKVIKLSYDKISKLILFSSNSYRVGTGVKVFYKDCGKSQRFSIQFGLLGNKLIYSLITFFIKTKVNFKIEVSNREKNRIIKRLKVDGIHVDKTTFYDIGFYG